ncbi:MAG: DUF2252 domain-containing protein [Microthrixaceae bacterium]
MPDESAEPLFNTPTRDTVADRRAAGRAARKVRPRSEFASWSPAADRQDPVAILEAQIPSRLQQLIPERHRRMLESPFAFYRGGAAIMAADLGVLPSTQLEVQLCGDSHLANFGLFGSPERELVFDVNDFDETHPGPWEWDVIRLAVSAVLLGRDRGWDDETQRQLVTSAAGSYRLAMRQFASMTNVDVWYSMMKADQVEQQIQHAGDRRRLDRSIAKARANDTRRAVEKYTEVVDGQRRFRNAPPLLRRLEDVYGAEHRKQARDAILNFFVEYLDQLPDDVTVLMQRYRLLDEALKVVGVGSVGTRCYIALGVGRDEHDLVILQIKEASESVLAPFWPGPEVSNQGKRVVDGQRLMQAASDPFLGWGHVINHDYYLRQFRDMKGSADLVKIRARSAGEYLSRCGWTLARAHARSGDAVAIAGYLGATDKFERAMIGFCRSYADQVQVDYDAFEAAASSGRIEVAAPPPPV